MRVLLAVCVVLVLSACTIGSPFPTPFASDHEVPRDMLEYMVVEHESAYSRIVIETDCDRGIKPGSGQVALCSVTYDNGADMLMGVALTSDMQMVTRSRTR